MATREIVHIGDPVLRMPIDAISRDELATPEIQQLIDDLIDTMHSAAGAGIAANQVGELKRICIIGVDRNPRYPYKPPIPLAVLVNPVVERLDDATYRNNEGCLSVPVRCDVDRILNIQVSAWNRHGEPFATTYRGLSAGTVQHEVDHLDGTLIVDRMDDTRTISTWQNFQKYGMASYLRRIAPVIAVTEPKVDDE